MTRIKLAFGLCLVVLLSVPTHAQQPQDPKVEIYIPTGMPIQLVVKRDESELTRNKYLVCRTTDPNVHKVKMFMVTSDPNEIKGREAVVWTIRDEMPASIAWGLDKRVDKLTVVIQRVETDEGVWLIDADDQQEALNQAIERGDRSLLQAKFIKKE